MQGGILERLFMNLYRGYYYMRSVFIYLLHRVSTFFGIRVAQIHINSQVPVLTPNQLTSFV